MVLSAFARHPFDSFDLIPSRCKGDTRVSFPMVPTQGSGPCQAFSKRLGHFSDTEVRTSETDVYTPFPRALRTLVVCESVSLNEG